MSEDKSAVTVELQSAFSEIFGGEFSISRLKIGDLSVIVYRLRSGGQLSREERLFLADFLEGKVKMPANRAPSYETEMKESAIVEAYLIEKELKFANKIAERVGASHRVSADHVHRLHRKAKANKSGYEALRKSIAARVRPYKRALAEFAAYDELRREDIRARWNERARRRRSDVERPM